MQTAKPKSRRKIIILAMVLIAVVAGGVAAFLLLQRSGSSGTPNFALSVFSGDYRFQSSWAKIDQSTTLLNGTSKNFVVRVNATGGFGDFVNLSLSQTITGLTVTFNQTVVRPATESFAVAGFTLTATSDIATRKDPFNLTVTGSGGSLIRFTTFPIRIRSTTLIVDPATVTVPATATAPWTFQVAVKVRNIYDMSGFQFQLSYNTAIVNASSTSIADDFRPAKGGYVAVDNINNTIGRVTIAAVFLGQCYVSAPCVNVEGSQEYTIANVTFTSSLSGNARGSTTITLREDILTSAIGENIITPPHHSHSSFAKTVRTTVTTVTCIPGSVANNIASTCTVTVTDAEPSPAAPTGTVSFASNSTGTFNPIAASCTLSGISADSASCSIDYTPTSAPGIHAITANYTGDLTRAASQDTFDLTVTT